VKEQAEKAFKEMLEISTDVDKAVLFAGDEVVVSNFSESLQGTMVKKAHELAAAGAGRAADMGSAPLTQMVVETTGGMVFLVREPQDGGMGILATAKKDSRIGLVFYDMKTCIRDAQEADDAAFEEEVAMVDTAEADAEPEVEA
jgi:predicted regulator of Ras-like GTPase activity (Roadblock/LC7/MglB family)